MALEALVVSVIYVFQFQAYAFCTIDFCKIIKIGKTTKYNIQRDSSLISHEIGHNLGMPHVCNNIIL